MGATKVVTDETFDTEVLHSSKPVVVDYWAEWCGPCKMVSPVLEEIAEEHSDKIDVVKLNIDENPTVSQKYQIMAIPTMSVFQNGEVVEVIGDNKISGLRIKNVHDGSEQVLPVSGMFVAIGHLPRSELFAGQLEIDPEGYLVVDQPTTHTARTTSSLGPVCRFGVGST